MSSPEAIWCFLVKLFSLQLPKHVSSGLLFGHPDLIPVPDLDRTDYLLMLGANPMQSNGSLCTAPDFPGRLKAIRQRGGKVAVVDPRRSWTAQKADEHLFIRPGTDVYLLLGIIHTLFGQRRAQRRPGDGQGDGCSTCLRRHPSARLDVIPDPRGEVNFVHRARGHV